ncbi:MAG: hypothetical protein QME60_06890 [Verrucomicrobiota bacterium]|nr:hypothetical protein [Verrucomicrobiota bacterium]
MSKETGPNDVAAAWADAKHAALLTAEAKWPESGVAPNGDAPNDDVWRGADLALPNGDSPAWMLWGDDEET